MSPRAEIPSFLADTWWFALTSRLDDEAFLRLVARRAEQGFTAAQIVVGIPPEVGPAHPSARSPVGPAWDRHGAPNEAYLRLAQARIDLMNRNGLTAIVFGGWGHQIDWIGRARMTEWWRRIVDVCDGLEVVYCLTGESDLWTSPIAARALLPDRSTDDLRGSGGRTAPLRRYASAIVRRLTSAAFEARRKARWSAVLDDLVSRTERPIIVHTTGSIDGFHAVEDPAPLGANTFQTGHARESEPRLWGRLLASRIEHPGRPVVNLEPWYEGIRGQFWLDDQVRALWMSVGAGARALCYGAHGIWNVGDGAFLAHWGAQTFEEALGLSSPAVLGAAYRMVDGLGALAWPEAKATVDGARLVKLRRADGAGRFIEYYPDAADVRGGAAGRVFDPLTGRFVATLPPTGQIVLVS
jgi:hypothetical protein